MADGDLYDEFGNYIGPELSESEEVRSSTKQPAPAAVPAPQARVTTWNGREEVAAPGL